MRMRCSDLILDSARIPRLHRPHTPRQFDESHLRRLLGSRQAKQTANDEHRLPLERRCSSQKSSEIVLIKQERPNTELRYTHTGRWETSLCVHHKKRNTKRVFVSTKDNGTGLFLQALRVLSACVFMLCAPTVQGFLSWILRSRRRATLLHSCRAADVS